MNGETTASKVNRLLQKSRQAFRIYSSMSKSAKAEHNEFADMQAIEWKNINAELIRQLTHIVEKYATKSLALQIARMRDLMLSDYRRVEAELNSEHREIIACAQRADFIRVAQLSRILISKKAFVQAAQAASHELSLIIDDKSISSEEEILTSSHNKQPGNSRYENELPVEGLQFSPSAVIPISHSDEVKTSADINYEEEEAFLFPRLAKVIPLRR